MIIAGLEWDSDEDLRTSDNMSIRRQKLETYLRQALARLPTGQRKVFEPFIFDSDQYDVEMEISGLISAYSDRYATDKEDTFQFMRTMRTLLPHMRDRNPRSTDIERVRKAQKRWLDTQSMLRIKRRFITRETFTRCQDLVRQILLHLSINARILSQEDETKTSDTIFQIKILGTPFARPKRGPNREGQDTFRAQLITYYNCQNGNNIWCPVVGQWIPKRQCTAAHIVPHSFPQHTLKDLLQPPDSTTMVDDLSEPGMVPQNGLYLYTPIEDALDEGKLVIVPRIIGTERIDFKVHLLDENLQENASFELDGEHVKWRSLEGKSLQFQNRNRPGKNFLYLQILLTIARKCLYQTPGWAYRLTEFIDVKEQVVLTPRPHLIDGPFMRLSKLITDATVFEQVRVTLPMNQTLLPESYSEEDIEQADEELDDVTTDLFLGDFMLDEEE